MSRRFTPAKTAALIAFLALAAPTAVHAQGDPSYRPRLTGIMVDGQHKFSQSAIVAASGLALGKPTSLQELADAANHLASIGVFKKVRYQYSNSATEISVQLHVEEETDLLPCILDNFIWYSDDELTADLREHVPFFDTVLPPGGDIIAQVEAELSRLVAAKTDSARVMHLAYSPALGQAVSAHLFQVTGIPLPIRAVHFPGANGKFLGPLSAASKELLQQDYSRLNVRLYAQRIYLPIYQEKGYLQADFRDSQVESVTANNKVGGFDVALAIPIKEGSIYKWNGAEWHGAKSLSVEHLNDGVGQSAGAPTNLVAFDRGLDSLLRDYQKSGYMRAAFDVKQIFDEPNSSVSFDIHVNEGARFRMGELAISGLPEHAADAIRHAWKLKIGDIYDGTYLSEFRLKELTQVLNSLRIKAASVAATSSLDDQKDQVDVTLIFK